MADKYFDSLKDLEKYMKTAKGQSYLLDQSNVKQALKSEMERLQKYLIEEINKHYSSPFQPTQYHRTGAWIESIKVNQVKNMGNSYSITLTFDDRLANHPSASGGADGYVPWLMEVGWKDKATHPTPHFEGFKGTHYIQNAVRRWNKDNKYGFTISVFHNNEKYI